MCSSSTRKRCKCCIVSRTVSGANASPSCTLLLPQHLTLKTREVFHTHSFNSVAQEDPEAGRREDGLRQAAHSSARQRFALLQRTPQPQPRFKKMAATCSADLPEPWMMQFAKMRPLIPAILQVVTALAIIVAGCFGEIGIGTPLWSGSMFVISGVSLLFLVFMRQTVFWEKCAFITIILSIVIALLAVILYCLEFALATLPESPFPHHGVSTQRMVLHYRVITAELALTAFELGISSWIVHILQKARSTLVD